MNLNDSKEVINICSSYLSHAAYQDYTIESPSSDGDSSSEESETFPSPGALYLESIQELFQSALNSIQTAFQLAYDDDEMPPEHGKTVNFIKLNSMAEMFRNHYRFLRKSDTFVEKPEYAFVCEKIFIAIKQLETAQIFAGGSTSELTSVLNKYDSLFASFIPETSVNPDEPSEPKVPQFWRKYLGSFKSEVLATLPTGTIVPPKTERTEKK